MPLETLKSLYESGLSGREVGEAVGLTGTTVIQRLRRSGMVLREKKGPTSKRSNVAIDDLVKMYESGLSLSQVARNIGVTKAAVRVRLHRVGVKMRSQDDYTLRHGAEHPHWKGGRTVSRDGYVLLTTGPCKRQLEHRVVMERVVGRRLKRSEYVHHINGIRDDNRPENLILTTPTKHESRTFTKALQRRICYLESLLKDRQNAH